MSNPFNLDSATLSNWPFQQVRKKPVIVHAAQINMPFEVTTLEGKVVGKAGDYLMMGIDGEKYPCARDIFERSYDFVTDEGDKEESVEPEPVEVIEPVKVPSTNVVRSSNSIPAAVGNKVSTGKGDWFAGTTWGDK